MRHIRVLATAAVLAAVISQPSAAQEGRQFKDAWFWGAKGGVVAFSSNGGTDNSPAPSVGIDWVITRSIGGLYVSFDQTFLSTETRFSTIGANGFADPLARVHNERRLALAALVFPMQSPRFHPYFGLGGAVHKIGSYNYLTDFTSAGQYSIAEDSIQSRKVAISPLVMGGLQMRATRFSVFGQTLVTFMPENYLINCPCSKRGLRYSVEGGIRYNVGTSIDKVR